MSLETKKVCFSETLALTDGCTRHGNPEHQDDENSFWKCIVRSTT